MRLQCTLYKIKCVAFTACIFVLIPPPLSLMVILTYTCTYMVWWGLAALQCAIIFHSTYVSFVWTHLVYEYVHAHTCTTMRSVRFHTLDVYIRCTCNTVTAAYLYYKGMNAVDMYICMCVLGLYSKYCKNMLKFVYWILNCLVGFFCLAKVLLFLEGTGSKQIRILQMYA